jgi:RimJ/RimL family protein N-acetyltransferase
MPQFMPPTSLTDGVVTLRPWRDDDAEALVRRINDADVAAFLDLVPQPYTLADAREWFVISRGGWRSGTSATFGIHLDGVEGVAASGSAPRRSGSSVKWVTGGAGVRPQVATARRGRQLGVRGS